MKLSGWGRYPNADCVVNTPRDEAELARVLADSPAIARGNGRAYGDSAMNPANTVSTRHLNHMISFDPATGQLVAEAGVLLGDVIDAFLPRGWFPAVTPGTKFVTLGGAIAADVHGKNHHVDGGFGNFVDWVDVMGPGGEVARASPTQNADLFHWTVGGMGLTGVILQAAIRLRAVETGWIRQHTLPAPDLTHAMELFETHHDAPYSVAWIDCLSRGPALGRSLVMLGEHAPLDTLPNTYRKVPFGPPARTKLTIPFNAPAFALNGLSVRAFNALYYRMGQRNTGISHVPWDSYFYPLDSILGWNRIYGRRGFIQFQCVLPQDSAQEGLRALLNATSKARQGSFLAVLKKLGDESRGFSFPMPGYTLALDFPLSEKVLSLMNDLDQITLEFGGRFYLAKDARMAASTLRASDPRCEDFAHSRRVSGTFKQFTSLQSERLKL